MQITVLCKVVDNFGDIGVVYRLCKQLFFVNKQIEINLIVDDLSSFNKICNLVNPDLSFQKVENLNVYNWNSFEFCYKEFLKNDGEKLSLILECFQCGRPDWMEKILFEDKLKRISNIIMIDYLTAEKYAEDFHCLKSLTRSSRVQKVNFMPGFTSKTGGLIIDSEWKNLKPYNKDGPVLVFTYERNFHDLILAINDCFNNKMIYLAKGKGFLSFKNEWDKFKIQNNCKNKLIELDYINQTDWDIIMQNCSLLIIRGEESMSRACLSGIPFIWHAYPQSDEYQIVKVNALLEKLEPFFSKSDFCLIKNVWNDINKLESDVGHNKFYEDCKKFFNNIERLTVGFKKFAEQLRKNGDLATNLMTFINKIDIIK